MVLSSLFCSSNSTIYLFSSPSPSISKKYSTFHSQIKTQLSKLINNGLARNPITLLALFGPGLFLTLMGPATASAATELQFLGSSLRISEPLNALSLPTWAIHVSSVVESIIAMALVWEYGDKSQFKSWKGLSWGMVPLLCACTWHFFYNSKSLEVLVALQAALTVIGNATMCIAAYRIYKLSEELSKNPRSWHLHTDTTRTASPLYPSERHVNRKA